MKFQAIMDVTFLHHEALLSEYGTDNPTSANEIR